MVNRTVRALGIDYGRRRIGLALSDATGLLARPWKTIPRQGSAAEVAAALAREITALMSDDDGLGTVVIGLPRRLSGEANEQTPHVKRLVAELQGSIGIPVVTQDERLSSREAEGLLARTEKDWRKRKPLLDATAAAVILQDYLDGQPRVAAGECEGEDS